MHVAHADVGIRRRLPVLGFCLAVSVLTSSPRPTWWEVRLVVNIRGEYTVKVGGATFSGEYAYGALWEGTMEKDGQDFLLYHIRTEPQKWEVREKATQANAVRTLTEKDITAKPALQMKYILREGGELVFDFDVTGIPIPLAPAAEKFDLVLPCSRGHTDQGAVYSLFLARGDNRVAVPDDRLERRSDERSFSWEWKRQQWALRDDATLFVSNRHKAEALVTLKSH